MPSQHTTLHTCRVLLLTVTLVAHVALASLVTTALVGCGRTEPPTNTSDSNNTTSKTPDPDPQTADAQAPAYPKSDVQTQTTSPLASAVAGHWLSIDNSMLTGLAFLPSHQLRTTHLRHADRIETETQTLPYTLSSDSRLTLTNLNGEPETYQLKIDSNLLTLQAITPSTSATTTTATPMPTATTHAAEPGQIHRYERLPASTTVAKAHLARWQVKSRAYDARRRALEQFLLETGLLLTIEPTNTQSTQLQTPPLAPVTSIPAIKQIALSVTGGRTRLIYAGQAWPQADTPIQTGVVIALKHLPQTHTSFVNISLDSAQLTHTDLAKTLPAMLLLRVTGDAEHLVIDDVIQNNFNQPQRISLKQNPLKHDVIVKAFREETARRKTMTDAIVQTLKDYAILKGKSAISGDQAPGLSNDTIYLLRDTSSTSPLWQGEIHTQLPLAQNDSSTNTQAAQPTILRFAAAAVTIQNNRPVLVIPAGSKTYTYRLDNGFTGHWSHTGFTTAYPSNLQVALAMDMPDYIANKKALRDKINTITSVMTLAGLAPIASHPHQLTPVTIQITLHDDDTVTAQAHYTLFNSHVNFTGKLLQLIQGPAIILNIADIPAAQPNVRMSAALLTRKLGKQQWHLALADTGPVFLLQGTAQGEVHENLRLSLVNETWQARQTALLNQLLTSGSTLKVVWPTSAAPDAPDKLSLKLDPASLVITGQHLAKDQAAPNPYKNPYKNAASPEANTIQGSLSHQGIWPGLTLKLNTARNQYTMQLIVFEHDNQPALNGLYYNTLSPQAETYLQLEKVSE